MSTPRQYLDRFEQGLGMESEAYEREWQQFLREREQIFNEITGRMQLNAALQSAHPELNATQRQPIADAVARYAENSRTTPPMSQSQWNDLLGAARFYGIPDPEKIPPQELVGMLQAYRTQMREGRDEDDFGVVRTLYDFTGALTTGTLGTLIDTAQRIPFLGDFLAKRRLVQEADQWIGMVNEGFTAELTEDELRGYSIGRGLSGMMAYLLPASAAWRVAGHAGKLPFIGNLASRAGSLGPRLGPIARMAGKGAMTSWLLEGGGDAPLEQRAMMVGFGAAFGAGAAVGGRTGASIVGAGLGAAAGGAVSEGDARWIAAGAAGGAVLGPLAVTFARARQSFPGAGFSQHTGQPGAIITRPPRPGAGAEGPVQGGTIRAEAPVGREVGGFYETVPSVTGQLPPAPRALPAPARPSVAPEPPPPPAPSAAPVRSLRVAVGSTNEPMAAITANGTRIPLQRMPIGRMLPDGNLSAADGSILDPSAVVRIETDTGKMLWEAPSPVSSAAPPIEGVRLVDVSRSVKPYEYSEIETPEFRFTFVGAADNINVAAHLSPGGNQVLVSIYPETYSAVDVGPAVVRQIGREVVQQIRAAGFNPQTIVGERVSGAHPGEIVEVPVDRLFRDRASAREAAQETQAITKQATIIESPAVAEMSRQPRLDDSDVAIAAMTSNPGQINIIRNVGDIAKTITQLTRASVEGRLMPHQIRVVERKPAAQTLMTMEHPGLGSIRVEGINTEAAVDELVSIVTGGRQLDLTAEANLRSSIINSSIVDIQQKPTQFDILVSDGLPITNKRVEQYKQFGFFEGQKVVTFEGQEFYVEALGGELVTVKSPHSGQSYQYWPHEIMAGRTTAGGAEVPVPEAPAMYKQFRLEAQESLAEELSRAGLQPFDWLSPETSTQLPRLMEEYFDRQGITNPVTRAALQHYFDLQRVQDFKAAIPAEEAQTLAAVQSDVAAEALKLRAEGLDVTTIHDAANAKNLVAVPTGNGGYEIYDQLSDLVIPVESEAAAREAISELNREVPDVAPESAVPIELIETPFNAGDASEPQLHAEELADITYQQARNAERELLRLEAGAGGGGGGGGLPPAGGAGFGMAGGAGSLPPSSSLAQQFKWARRSSAQRLFEIEQELQRLTIRYLTPFRDLTIKLQTELQDLGVSQAKLWEHYSDVVNAGVRAHNEALPWLQEWNDIMSQFRRKMLRDGTVTKIAEIQGNAKINAMIDAGFNEREIAAMARIRDFNDRFFRFLVGDPAFTLTADRYIWEYMSHVRRREAAGHSNPFNDEEGVLPYHLKFFAEMPRRGIVSVRELDPRVLGQYMVRQAMFKKHMAEPWNRMAEAWDVNNEHSAVPAVFRNLVKGWLETVQFGHQPGYDAVVIGMKNVLRRFGLPVTDADMLNLTGGVVANMYRAGLGLRPDVWARDSVQPLLAGVEVGMKPIMESYWEFLRGDRAAMWERGLRHGWVEVGAVRSPHSEIFAREVLSQEGTPLLPENMASRREALARIGDAMWDLMPAGARKGMQGTWLDPLYIYTKEGMFNRLITGEAGYQLARKALERFGRGELTFEQLRIEAGISSLERPIQDKWEQLVRAGDFEGAAALRGNELANSQFRYGAKEQPVGIREAQTAGRFGMQYGTFTLAYIARMRSLLSQGTVPEILARVARYGAVTGVLWMAGKASGFDFSKWMWHKSLTFLTAGGPLIEQAVEGYQALRGTGAAMQGRDPTPSERRAMQNMGVGGLARGAAEAVFPYAGGVRSLMALDEATNAPEPFRATSRFLLTGETGGIAPDIRRFFEGYTVPAIDYERELEGLMLNDTPGAGGQ